MKKKMFIAPAEQALAAKYFALSNLAMLHYLQFNGNNLQDAYYRADQDLQYEVGTGAGGELKDWEKMIKRGDSYCYEEWQKVRTQFVK